VPGKLPGWLGGAEPLAPEACVGLRLVDRASDRRAVVIPGLRELDAATRAEIEAADCALVDGTFFTRDELRAQRPGAPDAVAMGHTPITGPEGTLELLSGLSGRRVYIHMNNTNPAVDAGSREAALIASAGVEIAADGLELDV
jgi:pyrroloquinoline quinone biosynthesis protein B